MNPQATHKGRDCGVHPIQVVAQRTGLTADVLRIWERRYGAVRPTRSATGRRLYSDRDVEHLLLLRRATLRGRSISQVAELDEEELRTLVEADEVAAARSPKIEAGRRRSGSGVGDRQGANEYREACIEAIRGMDTDGLEKSLSIATLELTPAAVVDLVIVPLMNEIGDGWAEGNLRVAHEHQASAVVRTFLGNQLARSPLPETAPCIIAGTPAGHDHELGALVVVATASAAGWRSVYLGPNLPAEEFAATARATGARVMSLIYPADDPRLAEELREIRRLAPQESDIVLGGPAAKGYDDVIQEIGGHYASDMEGLRAVLERLRLRRTTRR
jgi:DNA-binding transcriptional MerR regulator